MVKAKLKAALLHCLVSLTVALIAAFLVFNIWFPSALSDLAKGSNLFLLILSIEICLGPLMSLVIYNPNKPRSELIRDYIIIGLVQLAALVYGLMAVAESRPVYLVFVKDRIEVVAASEIEKTDLLQGSKPFNRLTWFGPKLICVEFPTDPIEKSALLQSGLTGKDIQLMPKYYRECEKDEIINKAYTVNSAKKIQSVNHQAIDAVLSGDDNYKWLPIVSRFENWMIVYPNGDINNPLYIDDDPFM